MKRPLLAIALTSALALTGCTGGSADSGSADTGQGSGGSTAAEETPQPVQLDEAALTDILESTSVDGTTFTSIDLSSATDNPATAVLDQAEFDPAECKTVVTAALSAAQESEGPSVAGVSADSTMTLGLASFPDDQAAASQVATSSSITQACGNVTMTVQGMEMTMSSTPVDAAVSGADESYGSQTSVETGGQSALSANTVVARVGSTVVTAATVAETATEQDAIATAEAAVAAVRNAN